MSGLVEHILRAARLAAHACHWESLPLTEVPSAAVTDDDTEQWGDLIYMNRLLDDTVHLCVDMDGVVAPLSRVESDLLEAVWEEVRDDARWAVDPAVVTA